MVRVPTTRMVNHLRASVDRTISKSLPLMTNLKRLGKMSLDTPPVTPAEGHASGGAICSIKGWFYEALGGKPNQTHMSDRYDE